MKCELLEIAGKQIIKIELIPIYQKNKRFFLSKIPADIFAKIYTVEPAEYDINRQTTLSAQFKDDAAYYNYLIEEDKERIESRPFQRKENKKRVKEISEFLNTEEFALFPNSIIATCELANDYLETELVGEINSKYLESIFENDSIGFLNETDDKFDLYIPYEDSSILVIDGQHRIKGIENSDLLGKEKYELIVSFIIGYDRSSIAKLFYTINYTQKSVNKSILYHLTGEFSKELNEITFLHGAVKLLNEHKKSPFYRRVKMLGDIPKEITKEDRQFFTISQAFLVDYLINTISKSSTRSIHQPIFYYYYVNEDYQIEIIRFLIKYFSAIKELKLDDWDNPSESIICRTVSIGAFIRVMHFLYIKLFYDKFAKKPAELFDLKKENIMELLSGIQKIDFSKEGEFGGVASGGTLNKLKIKIIENLKFFGQPDYETFLSDFKSNYLNAFGNWVTKITAK